MDQIFIHNEHYFPVVLFLVQYKVVLTFESVDEERQWSQWMSQRGLLVRALDL